MTKYNLTDHSDLVHAVRARYFSEYGEELKNITHIEVQGAYAATALKIQPANKTMDCVVGWLNEIENAKRRIKEFQSIAKRYYKR